MVDPLPSVLSFNRFGRQVHPPGHWSKPTRNHSSQGSSLLATIQHSIRTKLQERKLQAARQAAICNKHHRIEHTVDTTLNNRRTDITPSPPPRHRAEMSIALANRKLDPSVVKAGLNKELTKLFDNYKALRSIARSDIEPDAVYLRSQMLVKLKAEGRVTGRLVIDGS